eukprot:1860209-Rhodomonas_salina.4
MRVGLAYQITVTSVTTSSQCHIFRGAGHTRVGVKLLDLGFVNQIILPDPPDHPDRLHVFSGRHVHLFAVQRNRASRRCEGRDCLGGDPHWGRVLRLVGVLEVEAEAVVCSSLHAEVSGLPVCFVRSATAPTP